MYRERVVVQNNNSGGIGLAGALTLVFVTLKLVGVINWSWLWVLAPLWISFGIFVIVMLIALIVYLIASAL